MVYLPEGEWIPCVKDSFQIWMNCRKLLRLAMKIIYLEKKHDTKTDTKLSYSIINYNWQRKGYFNILKVN